MKPDLSGTTRIDTSKLPKGVCVFVLSDSKNRVEFKVLKLCLRSKLVKYLIIDKDYLKL